MENIDNDQRLELIVETAIKCADILKDPSETGLKDLSAEKRNSIREEVHEELIKCIYALESLAEYNIGFFDVLNIAAKYKIHEKAPK